MTYKAIIFDVDGVLVDSEKFIAQAALRLFDRLGIQVNQDEFKPYIGTGEQKFLEGIAAKYDIRIPTDAKKQLYGFYKEQVTGKLQMIKGARNFIEVCRKNKFKMAIATSSDSDKMLTSFNAVGIEVSMFDAIVTGDEVTNRKPDPEIFLLSCKKLNINPQDCLVVEDSVNGVIAAKAAGCGCLGITSTFDKSALHLADLIADDFTSLSPENILG